ncbi:MAG: phage integrase N-terminal SAM-like domain-containing protein [Sphaerochaeta sp.]
MTLFQAKAKLIDDMKLRNFSENTITSYYCICLKFLDFTKVKDTSRLSEKEFRAYLLHLGTKDLSASSINVHNSAVRFFYEVTLEKDINYKRVPHMKEPTTRPEILTVGELTSFFAEVVKPKRFAFYLNLYTSGLRISEMLALRTDDIDGERMCLIKYFSLK